MNTLTRQLHGEREMVLQILNGLPSPNSRRAGGVLRQMQQAEKLRLVLFEHYPQDYDKRKDEFADPKMELSHVEFLNLQQHIRETLKRYKWTPIIGQSTALFDTLEEGFDLPKTPRPEYFENLLIL